MRKTCLCTEFNKKLIFSENPKEKKAAATSADCPEEIFVSSLTSTPASWFVIGVGVISFIMSCHCPELHGRSVHEFTKVIEVHMRSLSLQ